MSSWDLRKSLSSLFIKKLVEVGANMVPMAVPNNCFLTLHFYNFNKLSVGMCSFSFSSKASLRAIKSALCGILG